MSIRYKLRIERTITIAALILIIPVCLFVLNGIKRNMRIVGKSEQKLSEQQGETQISPDAAVTTTTIETKHITRINEPTCKAAAVYTVDNKQFNYKDNIDAKVAPASLTKLLTAAVALKNVKPETVFTVGEEQWLVQPNSSLSNIEVGNTLTLKTLITGMLMASGNDAAYAVAVNVAREMNPSKEMSSEEAVDYFCGLMNDMAAEIGMTNSKFVNPDGWDDEEQYTTVSDLVKLAEYVLGVPEIMEITATYQTTVQFESGENATWINSNLLLDEYSDYYCEEAIGMKTGTTPNAGNCLIAAFKKSGITYITVVSGCDYDTDRYELTLKFFNSL